MLVLGIESSCDESAASVIKGDGDKIKVLSSIISSQVDIHRQFGGVVPEIAAREHVGRILPVVDQAIKKAGIKKPNKQIDLIGVTAGPGLISSLMVGIETAKSLAYTWDKEILPINHIEGHICANFIDQKKEINFPALILTVSGGHNILVLMRKKNSYKIIGETLDDAAGEAFDKAAQLLGIGYPGGPLISKLANQNQNSNYKIELPRPMLNSPDFNFSFSGLKTALLYKLKKDEDWSKKIPAYCQEFQSAVVDVLVKKTIKAAKKLRVKTVMLAGGVSANQLLRETMKKELSKQLPETIFLLPELNYTTDNAAMIAAAAYLRWQAGKRSYWSKIKADCNLELGSKY